MKTLFLALIFCCSGVFAGSAFEWDSGDLDSDLYDGGEDNTCLAANTDVSSSFSSGVHKMASLLIPGQQTDFIEICFPVFDDIYSVFGDITFYDKASFKDDLDYLYNINGYPTAVIVFNNRSLGYSGTPTYLISSNSAEMQIFIDVNGVIAAMTHTVYNENTNGEIDIDKTDFDIYAQIETWLMTNVPSTELIDIYTGMNDHSQDYIDILELFAIQ